MSFYDNESFGRQSSWEQQAPPSRSGAGSAMSQQSDTTAFASQFEEIERATDNLMKSGKWLPGAMMPAGGSGTRRDSVPAIGRGSDNYSDPRMGGSSRHHSVSDYEGGRPGSAGLQGYYAGQRFPGGRQSEAEQMLQAKRRMAAQRERELRNYHQEQQYNRGMCFGHVLQKEMLIEAVAVSGAKSDRAMSPNTMSEEDRRELIARQHRALYGDNSSLYGAEGSGQRRQSQDVRVSGAGRGASPLAFDPFGQAQAGAEGAAVQMPPRDRANSTASPASNSATQQSYNLLNEAQQSSRTSASSPGESPPLGQGQKGSMAGVAPIGTRPMQQQAAGLNKRSTTPLTPSSLSYGFNAESQNPNIKDERSPSSASNPPLEKGVGGLGGWGGSNSGVWGSGKGSLAVQPSVWG